ncbi:MAG: hypothetical protein ACREA0_03080 [bacterium]
MQNFSVILRTHSHEDALAKISRWLKEKWETSRHSYVRDGAFQVPLRSIISEVLQEQWAGEKPHVEGPHTVLFDEMTNTGSFVDAAWDLCRRGILAPAMVRGQMGLTFPGDQFRLTEYGEQWIGAYDREEVFPTEPERFAAHLAKHAHRFRQSYTIRSQEAVKCYRAAVYLACCTMCGAAAESILLSLAVAKVGDEERILRDYRASTGVAKIKHLLQVQQNAHVVAQLDNFTELIKYWRDEAAHAFDSSIDEEEAFLAMLLLLRLARFADQRWEDIVGH